MSSDFDPYRKWLGIPANQQPPNHYRLLGLERFEDDPDTIDNAADRLMAHIRTFQTGRHADHSQRILNEIASARTCLLNDDQRAKYDDSLRAVAPAGTSENATEASPEARSRSTPGRVDANTPASSFAETSTKQVAGRQAAVKRPAPSGRSGSGPHLEYPAGEQEESDATGKSRVFTYVLLGGGMLALGASVAFLCFMFLPDDFNSPQMAAVPALSAGDDDAAADEADATSDPSTSPADLERQRAEEEERAKTDRSTDDDSSKSDESETRETDALEIVPDATIDADKDSKGTEDKAKGDEGSEPPDSTPPEPVFDLVGESDSVQERRRIDNLIAATARVETFHAFYEDKLQGVAQVHYRVFLPTNGGDVDLFRSDLNKTSAGKQP